MTIRQTMRAVALVLNRDPRMAAAVERLRSWLCGSLSCNPRGNLELVVAALEAEGYPLLALELRLESGCVSS